MERLTKRYTDATLGAFMACASNCINEDFDCNDCVKLDEIVARLAAYEDTMPLERAKELAKAEKDGRLVVLPCKNDTVYTIKEDYFNCAKCRHGGSAYYQAKTDRVSCDVNNDVHCPLYVEEHKVDGFEVKFDASGSVALSGPVEFGYEGLELFCGVDGKVYYTHAEAEAALKKMEGGRQ